MTDFYKLQEDRHKHLSIGSRAIHCCNPSNLLSRPHNFREKSCTEFHVLCLQMNAVFLWLHILPRIDRLSKITSQSFLKFSQLNSPVVLASNLSSHSRLYTSSTTYQTEIIFIVSLSFIFSLHQLNYLNKTYIFAEWIIVRKEELLSLPVQSWVLNTMLTSLNSFKYKFAVVYYCRHTSDNIKWPQSATIKKTGYQLHFQN